jgi:hypothetical protein
MIIFCQAIDVTAKGMISSPKTKTAVGKDVYAIPRHEEIA